MAITKQVDRDVEIAEGDTARDDDGIGPTGKWKYGLFGCCDVLCRPLCLVGTCCDCIVWGQLMSRLGLNWCGVPDPATAASTFGIVVLLAFAYWASVLIVVGLILTPCYLVYMVWIVTKTRYEARQRFQIAPDYCGCGDGIVEDCLCANCCRCCTSIQIARHTHDETRYPYTFDAPTGLPPEAPPLVAEMESYQ